MTIRNEGRLRRWLRAPRESVEEDVDAELAFHREMRERDFTDAGLDPEAARRAASAKLGDLDDVKRWLTKHDRRRTRRLKTGELVMELMSDVRYALRKLAQQPAFTIAVIALLALGTGATTAIFSAVDAVLIRPLAFADADRLVLVDAGVPFDAGVPEEFPQGAAELPDVRAMSDVFTDVAAYAPGGLNLSDEADPRRVRVGVVTPNLFPLLGVSPALGRGFSPAEEEAGAPLVAILSDAMWRAYFGGQPDALGRDVVLNGKAYEVVGVMPSGFSFPQDSELWLPLPVPYTRATFEAFRQYLPSQTIARLAPGMTLDDAGARVHALHEQYGPVESTAAELVRPFREAMVGQRRTALVVLLGATSLVLLVACANVANLLLSRSTLRRREIALRSVLGATPGRVLRQLAVESLVLALIGSAAGVALALGGIRFLDVLVPSGLSGAAPLRADARVLTFALALALGTGLLFGLWPALEGRRTGAGDALKSGSAGTGTDSGTARVRRALVVGEIALALMLLVGSTLMLRSLHAVVTTETGVDAEGVVTLELHLARSEHAGAAGRKRFYEGVLAHLEGDPRVLAAAAVNELPMRGVEGIQLGMRPEAAPENPDAPYTQLIRVTQGYFRAMGVRVLAGRAPNPSPDDSETQEVAVSQSLARLFWPDRVPIGERLVWPGGVFEIVGLVADVRPTTLESEFIPQAYTAMMDSPDLNGALIVRGQSDPAELARILQDAVHAVAPTQAVYNVRTMDEVMEGAIQARSTNTLLITAFGVLALVLASVGVYGVMAFSVARRTREIGIRMALGARSSLVLRSVLEEGLLLALIGTMIGLAGAWALARVMSGLLFGAVTTHDPLAFTVAPLGLLVVSLLAVLIPAWRATRTDPLESLRME